MVAIPLPLLKFYIIQMVTIQQLLRHQPTDTQSLDLRSSKPEKIHRIDSLQSFTNLRSINLSNNMIVRIQNLNTLVHLRILNLEFNQISKLEGIKHLTRLQELFLSYNCIEVITSEIRHNQGLKVLHLAYNDLKSIEDVKPLSTLTQLTILSLVGNPFLSALNYTAFVKMLIPSLLLLDDRDANQSIIAANVYPHQEIFILRDALNKLLDQRNHRQHQQAQQMTTHPEYKESASKQHPSPRQGSDKEPLLELLTQWIETYIRKAQAKRQEINDLSESYSQCIKNSKKPIEKQVQVDEIVAKIKKYKMLQERGQLSQEKKQKMLRMSKELSRNVQAGDNSREESRTLLQLLKDKEGDYGKLKEKQQILKELRMKIENSPEPYRVLISHLIFGRSTHELDYRDIKRFLYDGKGLLYYLSTLKQVIFGEQADSQRIDRLKQFLGEKSLIQIINDLKQMGIKHKKQRKRYEKQRTKLIEKFQGEAQELCEQWRDLQKEKWILKNSRKSEQETSKSFLDERFAAVENQERTKIMLLKKEKEHYELKVEELQQKYEGLQGEFSRKYQQLEEFQRFFEEFKQEREIVNSLKGEIDTISQDLTSKQKLQAEIESNLRELTAREAALMEKASFYERKCYEKAQQLKMIEEKARNQQERAKRASEEVSLRHSEQMSLHEQLNRIAQQLREGDKMLERQRSSLEVYQQKLRNLSELQTNKRNSLSNLQAEVESQRRHLTDLTRKVEQAQEKLNRCLQAGYQAQLRLQENRKSTESLVDINRIVADMLERQSQLRRNVLQLQLQTQHLSEVKSQLMREIKLNYDDQDDNL